MTAMPETTIRDLVASDYRTAAIFQRYGLDFCCNGGRTIEQGCREAGADRDALIRELECVLATPASGVPRFTVWDTRTLIAYIVDNHHSYVRQAIPPLLRHTQKVATVHGDRHPELCEIGQLFVKVADDMADHMDKEERVLFPFIAALSEAARSGGPAPQPPFGTVGNPIRMMEADHQFAGDAMAAIRRLTSNYQPPENACATYRVCFQELEAFEKDLHEHVHLENNILFPRALRIEDALARAV